MFDLATETNPLSEVIRNLPLDAAARQRLLELARAQDPAVRRALERTLAALGSELAARPADDLEALLVSDAGYRQKVDVLLHAQQMKHPRAAAIVRRLIRGEAHPFVLATMVSTLGRLGAAAEDGSILLEMTNHADARVAANALEALDALGVGVPARRLEELLARSDDRLRANALALMGKTNPARVLDAIPVLLEAPAASLRARAAYLLGELPDGTRAIELLLDLLAREREPAVLRQVGEALQKQASPLTGTALIGRLYGLRESLAPSTKVLADMVLQQVAVAMGLVAAQVREIGERWVVAQKAAAARAPEPPRAPGAVADPELAEADCTMSFSSVWGRPKPTDRPQRPGIKGRVVEVAPAPPPPVPLWVGVPGLCAVLTLALSFWGGGEASAGPAADARPHPVHTRASVAAPASPAAPVAPVRTARPFWSGGGGAPDRASEAPAASDVPQIGAALDLDGEITMRAGMYPIMRANGRYWLLRGPAAQGLATGRPARVHGVLAGIGPNGLVYVDVIGS